MHDMRKDHLHTIRYGVWVEDVSCGNTDAGLKITSCKVRSWLRHPSGAQAKFSGGYLTFRQEVNPAVCQTNVEHGSRDVFV